MGKFAGFVFVLNICNDNYAIKFKCKIATKCSRSYLSERIELISQYVNETSSKIGGFCSPVHILLLMFQ